MYTTETLLIVKIFSDVGNKISFFISWIIFVPRLDLEDLDILYLDNIEGEMFT